MAFPTLIYEALPDALGAQVKFPFRSWATANRFTYPEHATDFLAQCGSAAEAFFARAFILRDDVVYIPFPRGTIAASVGQLILELQVPCTLYTIDALVSSAAMQLAIEVDGMAFHSKTREQVASDYLRERRLVLKGNTVIRFTAQEVMAKASECWRQVESIFAARKR